MATKAEAKNRALELLFVKTLGQSAQSQDFDHIEDIYLEVYTDLKTEGIATWAVAGTIPDDVMPHLAALMAFNSVHVNGLSPERYNRISAKASIAKTEIRTIVTPDYESLEEPEDF